MSISEKKNRRQRNLFLIIFILSLLNSIMIIAGASAITAMEDDGLDRAWIEEHIAFWNALVKIEVGILGGIVVLLGLKGIKWAKNFIQKK